MTGPEDFERDEDGRLRDVSEQWDAYRDSLNELPDALRDEDD